MTDHRASSALTAGALALLVGTLCGALLLPPMAQAVPAVPFVRASLLLTLVVAALAHWFFLVRAASRLGRHVPGWLALSVLLFPIGSAAALVLLGWLLDEPHAAPAR